jgi:hypothetical protein
MEPVTEDSAQSFARDHDSLQLLAPHLICHDTDSGCLGDARKSEDGREGIGIATRVACHHTSGFGGGGHGEHNYRVPEVAQLPLDDIGCDGHEAIEFGLVLVVASALHSCCHSFQFQLFVCVLRTFNLLPPRL